MHDVGVGNSQITASGIEWRGFIAWRRGYTRHRMHDENIFSDTSQSEISGATLMPCLGRLLSPLLQSICPYYRRLVHRVRKVDAERPETISRFRTTIASAIYLADARLPGIGNH